ncbi:uncharacterized protein BXIN_1020 [Babesia sp. Xinjiang]|uniref:uncharacterized protein n=1 Tax=Babesia sp. Xinjiang TaxID=462227 RepID=UPI000A23B7CA|nr:uncharacterized protein BXIN_1020 [Babesia sp. Xinjiang]ORM42023.1 hypothetical protein BXIN_1020 [Babesia sp. Xinjiang]
MECQVEEEVLILNGFKIRVGMMGRARPCGEAKLTSSRLTYNDGGGSRSISMCSIRQCKLKRCGMQRFIKITCIDVTYYVTCEGDLENFYKELKNVLNMHDTCNVIGRPDCIGGLSRVVQMKNERVEDADILRHNVMADFTTLKKKSQKIREMARHIHPGQRTLSKTFEALNLHIFESDKSVGEYNDTKEILINLMKDHDFILLQDLFCLVNRMRVCNLLTAKEVRAQVEMLQEDGSCKIVDIQGVATVVAADASRCLESVAQLVASGPVTPLQLAEAQSISVSLAEYKLVYAELEGVVTRDDGDCQVRYYRNPFMSWPFIDLDVLSYDVYKV